MSLDMTTKETTLFDKALDGKNFSWEEPVLDESGGSLDAEMPDLAAQPTSFEEEVHAPLNDNSGLPVSEPSMSGKEDPNDDEKPMGKPDEDISAEGSEVIGRDHLRQSSNRIPKDGTFVRLYH